MRELEEIAPRLQDIRGRIKSIEGEMKRLEHESQQQDQHLRLVEQFAVFQKKIGQKLDCLSFEDKRRILQLLVTEVAVDSVQGEITIKHILPIDETLPLHSRGRDRRGQARVSLVSVEVVVLGAGERATRCGVAHQIGGAPLPEAQEVEAQSLAIGMEWLLSRLAHDSQAPKLF